MALSTRGKVFLVYGIFFGIQAIFIGLAAIIIFTDIGFVITAYINRPDDLNIVDGNPGLSLRPLPNENSGGPSFLISYRSSDRDSFRPWANSLDDFLQVYKQPGLLPHRSEKIYNCDYDRPPLRDSVCDVDVKHYSPCITENYYDYHKSQPCVFLRLNVPPGWKPVYYNNTDSLPESMPAALKEYILNLKRTSPQELNTIWVTCEGENPADEEYVGPISYLPRRGFPGYYFLSHDVDGYLPPLVAVHFQKPHLGPLINIKCKAWARNIKHDNDTALGGVKFALLLE